MQNIFQKISEVKLVDSHCVLKKFLKYGEIQHAVTNFVAQQACMYSGYC